MHNITNHYSIRTQKGILLLNNFSIVIVTFQVETTRGEYLSINKQTFHQRYIKSNLASGNMALLLDGTCEHVAHSLKRRKNIDL